MNPTELVNLYKLLQKNCGLKINSQVTIYRGCASHDIGWPNTWTTLMDQYISKTDRIREISTFGIKLRSIPHCTFPFFVLKSLDMDYDEIDIILSRCLNKGKNAY